MTQTIFCKIDVATQDDYIALADAGKLKKGQFVNITETGRTVRYAGQRREGGSMTLWSKRVPSAQFSAVVRTMTI